MSRRLDELGARKSLLVAQLRLQRMELALHAGDVRSALRPAGLIGGAVAQPAAVIALVETIAPVFGLQRYARWVRLASIAFAVTRIARKWRESND
ncbi:MAG: hypothetical protein ACREYD_10445 [Casimicrobiaceae bacterium]